MFVKFGMSDAESGYISCSDTLPLEESAADAKFVKDLTKRRRFLDSLHRIYTRFRLAVIIIQLVVCQ